MSEYKTFQISLSTTLDNGEAIATVYFKDFDSDFEDKISYKMDLVDIEENGGNYIDNVAENLFQEAITRLIEQKKKYRAETFNIYDNK